ncbi:hypothetical protein BLOT_008817 [Blomia tropicalis]|nr:hypothetical protein BLOT_008817 [Blomia tropicalis]
MNTKGRLAFSESNQSNKMSILDCNVSNTFVRQYLSLVKFVQFGSKPPYITYTNPSDCTNLKSNISTTMINGLSNKIKSAVDPKQNFGFLFLITKIQ